jgi:hypothetical protein
VVLDSVVGIATHYELDVPGIDSPCGREILHSSIASLGSIQPPAQCVPDVFTGRKEAGAWRKPPTLSNTELKERVELSSPVLLACSRVNKQM